MTGYRYPRRPKPPPGVVQRGHRIVVVLCDDTVTGDNPIGDDIILHYNGDTGQLAPVIHRAYVDSINSGDELQFTACVNYKPFKRTRCKGFVRLRDEGITWMQGWSETALAALSAAYTLKDGTP